MRLNQNNDFVNLQKFFLLKHLISIVGTTGIGKTRLAIDLANHLDTEIISCDSRQFYKEMRIGTAMPTDEELAEAKHHFVGNLSVNDYYSIGLFEEVSQQKTLKIDDQVIYLNHFPYLCFDGTYRTDNIPWQLFGHVHLNSCKEKK